MANNDDKKTALFSIPLPGGRVARVPLEVLEQHVDDKARHCHAPGESPPPAEGGEGTDPQATTIHTGSGMITINIYTGQGEASIQHKSEDGDDVTAHSMSVDPTTGTSDWHLDWELGQCEYTDESGMPQSGYFWHRHPYGSEYTEVFEG